MEEFASIKARVELNHVNEALVLISDIKVYAVIIIIHDILLPYIGITSVMMMLQKILRLMDS